MMMHTVKAAAMALLIGDAIAGNSPRGDAGARSPCRFAPRWTSEDVISNTDNFVSHMLRWESNFHQDGVAYNAANGMSYDGSQIDWDTGAATLKHEFSAASKEALQIMIYARAVEGSKEAAKFLNPDHPAKAHNLALSIMEKKLETYRRFNETYPGFGGHIPWVTTSSSDISPTPDWVGRVPALDNGELWWAVYAWIEATEKHHGTRYQRTSSGWKKWLDHVTTTMEPLFHRGGGVVCAVTEIADQTLPVNHPDQSYKCEGDGTLIDPYEGELVTYYMDLFGDLSPKEKDALWESKRPYLIKDEYIHGEFGPITVEKGYWFSAHEPWKVLELPYYDVDIVRRLYHNHERVRTCNSVLTGVPGLFASVNNVTDPETDTIVSYISPAGIPSIANQTDQYLEVVTPYASWPTILFDRGVGLAWWRNMAAGKKMQNPFGSTESSRVDGAGVSALLTWDAKVLPLVALVGGVQDLVRQRLKKDGRYETFVEIAKREYSMVFGDTLNGENCDLCLPDGPVLDGGLEDFTLCSE